MWKVIYIHTIITDRTILYFNVMEPLVAWNSFLNRSVLKSLYFSISYSYKWQFENSRSKICAGFFKNKILTRPFLTDDGLCTSILIKCQSNSLQVTFSIAFILLLILMMFPEGIFLGIKLHCFSVYFHSIGILDMIWIMFKKEALISYF